MALCQMNDAVEFILKNVTFFYVPLNKPTVDSDVGDNVMLMIL